MRADRNGLCGRPVSMLCRRRLSVCLVALMAIVGGMQASGAVSTLDVVLRQVDGAGLTVGDGPVRLWDWSGLEPGDEAVDELTAWGDTVVSLWMHRSPLWPLGVRRDYRVGSDGVTRLCREDRDMVYHDTLPVPVYLSRLLTATDSIVSPVAKTGRLYRHYNTSAIGTSTLKHVARGTVVVPR